MEVQDTEASCWECPLINNTQELLSIWFVWDPCRDQAYRKELAISAQRSLHSTKQGNWPPFYRLLLNAHCIPGAVLGTWAWNQNRRGAGPHGVFIPWTTQFQRIKQAQPTNAVVKEDLAVFLWNWMWVTVQHFCCTAAVRSGQSDMLVLSTVLFLVWLLFIVTGCAGFSSLQGLSLVEVHGLLLLQSTGSGARGLNSWGSWALEPQAQ